MNPQEELVVIVDERNRIVGSAKRRDMRAQCLNHRSTHILVFNSGGKIFVQKRSSSKDVFPGYLDTAAGGIVLAGESYEDGAKRELEEELGIRNIPLKQLFEFFFATPDTRVWGSAFSCVYDREIVLQKEEIDSGEFMEIDEVFDLQKTEPFTPDGLYVLQKYLGHAVTERVP